MTRGGRNTKIHAIVDGLGNPLYVQLSGGQVSDIAMAYELLEHVDVSGSVVMADRAYGAADLRIKIEKSGATYCIPPKSNTTEPWDVDWWQYKERSQVECFFQKIKNYRRIATFAVCGGLPPLYEGNLSGLAGNVFCHVSAGISVADQ